MDMKDIQEHVCWKNFHAYECPCAKAAPRYPVPALQEGLLNCALNLLNDYCELRQWEGKELTPPRF